MNLFSEKPDVREPVCPEFWTCPITGLIVPKRIEANLAWRRKMLEKAEKDDEFKDVLYTACSKSVLFFVNAFGWTFRLFGPEGQAENKHLPFVTWPFQDEHVAAIENAISKGCDLGTDKARDMGATWAHIIVIAHRFLFKEDESFLLVSRKEDLVDLMSGLSRDYPHDVSSDPDTLFGKLDYFLRRLPSWMLPSGMARKKLHLTNAATRCRIDGESSNANLGIGGRRTAILCDEFALLEDADKVKQGTADVSKCRLINSAHYGPGSDFAKWMTSGKIKVYAIDYWLHPEKAKGLYLKQDEIGRWKVRSKWYDDECAKRSPKEVASQIDRDYLGSGNLFFETTSLDQHIKLFGEKPKRSCHIRFVPMVSDEAAVRAIRNRDLDLVEVSRGIHGPWRIWRDVQLDGQEKWNGRPDQHYRYVLGVDISRGQGASNSVITVLCEQTREKIAEFCDNTVPPYDLARICVAAAIWVGGIGGLPQIIYEANGNPGYDFGRQLVNVYRYPVIWQDRTVGRTNDKATKKWGFASSRDKKAVLLGLLRRSYAHGRFLNHSIEACEEAKRYAYLSDGSIGPAEDETDTRSERNDHGDRVIADALAVWAAPHGAMIQEKQRDVPFNSVGYRMQQHFAEKRKAERERKRMGY